jgi:catechol 2,3-dioxygenase-like lactoylglutathione lyase family enzyme
MTEVLGLHHVQLAMPVGGEDQAVEFYEGLLGLHRVSKPEKLEARGGCWFRGISVETHLGSRTTSDLPPKPTLPLWSTTSMR